LNLGHCLLGLSGEGLLFLLMPAGKLLFLLLEFVLVSLAAIVQELLQIRDGLHELSLFLLKPIALSLLFVTKNQQGIAGSREVAAGQGRVELLERRWGTVGLCCHDSQLRSALFVSGRISGGVLWVRALQSRHAASLPGQNESAQRPLLAQVSAREDS